MKSELSPVEKRLVWDEAKEAELQKLRHMKAAAEACKGISTEALEAGVVEKMRKMLKEYEDSFCEAYCHDNGGYFFDCSGCDARKTLALLETKEKSDG